MSRTFAVGVLVLLVVLLGVMRVVVGKATETPKPTPEQTAQMQKAQAERQKQEMETMKQRAADAKKQAAKQAAAAKKAGVKNAPKKPDPYGVMDISEDWDRRRPEGQAGVDRLIKEDAARAPKQNQAPFPSSAAVPSIPGGPGSPGAMMSGGMPGHEGHGH